MMLFFLVTVYVLKVRESFHLCYDLYLFILFSEIKAWRKPDKIDVRNLLRVEKEKGKDLETGRQIQDLFMSAH